MLRSQTLVTLKEYHSALFDVNRLIELDPSSEVYRNLESRLRTQLVDIYFLFLALSSVHVFSRLEWSGLVQRLDRVIIH